MRTNAIRLLVYGLVLIAVAALLYQQIDVLHFLPDTAQHLSTTQHLMAGDGPLTSVLYYDSQLARDMPARQTVWPPGVSLITAAISTATNLDPAFATGLLAVAGHLLTSIIVMLLIRQLQIGWSWAVLAAIAWLMSVPAWVTVSHAMSEPLYQLFAMAAGLFVALSYGWERHARIGRVDHIHRFDRWGYAAAAALAFAACVAVRYQAIALVPPLLMATTLNLTGRVAGRRLLMAVIVVGPALALLAYLLRTNWQITGNLTGGAAPGRGQYLTEMADQMIWLPEDLRASALALLVVSAFAAGLWSVWLWYVAGAPRRRAVLVFCLGLYASNIAMFVLLGVNSVTYTIEWRYLGVNVLSALVAGTWLLGSILDQSSLRAQFIPKALVIAIVVAQCIVFYPRYRAELSNAPAKQLQTILEENQVAGKSAFQYLSGEVAQRAVLMSTHAQTLSLLISGGRTIGVPADTYTPGDWDAGQLYRLALKHDARLLVAFRELNSWTHRGAINRMLDKTPCPAWLMPLLATDDLIIAKVVATSAQQRMTCQ